MNIRFRTYAFVVLLLLIGVGPAVAEECCKTNSSTKCCCVDTETFEVCTPQLCADVKFQDQGTLFVPPSSEVSSQLVQAVIGLLEYPRPRAHLSIAATVLRERAPPPLFADLTLCFLPPPALS